MITQDEFIKKYHDYGTQSQITAITEALMVNAEGILDDLAVAVKFGELGYGLMLKSTVKYLMEPEEEME